MKPALPAFVLRTRIPRNRERLQTTVRKLDEILLKGIDAECVLDGEISGRTVTAVGSNVKATVAFEEPARGAGVRERRVAEVAEDRSAGRLGHRVVMLRSLPRG